jgi:glycosyltransferase involved in cell wall biosynthesis
MCDGKIKTIRCSVCFASQKYSLVESVAGGIITTLKPVRKKYPALNFIPNKKQSMKYLSEYVHTNIAIAKWIEKKFLNNNVINTEVISQAIDTSKFTPKKNYEIGHKIRLGFIGRMNPTKGFHVLLEALEKTGYINKIDLTVVTIKDSSELGYYKKINKQYSQLGFSEWFENISHQEINKLMDNWDLLILPSIANEVAPLVILEAFAKSLPVIGSNYPAIAEMIEENRTGFLFQNRNSEELAFILNKIINNVQILEQLRKNIEKPRDLSTLVKEHLYIYNKLF